MQAGCFLNFQLITPSHNTGRHNFSHVKESILVSIQKVHPAFDRSKDLCEYGVREDNDAVNSSQKQLAAQQKNRHGAVACTAAFIITVLQRY